MPSAKPAKPFHEALPSIDILVLDKHWRRGVAVCVWRDEQGRQIGYFEVLTLDAERLCIRQTWHGTVDVPATSGHVTLPVSWSVRNETTRRPCFACPICDRPAQMLHLVLKRWSCRRCHGLCNLGDRLGRERVQMRLRDELRESTAQGPRRYQRKAAYQADLTRLAALDLIYGDRVTPPESAELQRRATATWQAEQPPAVALDAAGYGWKPGMAGGFERLEHPALVEASEVQRESGTSDVAATSLGRGEGNTHSPKPKRKLIKPVFFPKQDSWRRPMDGGGR